MRGRGSNYPCQPQPISLRLKGRLQQGVGCGVNDHPAWMSPIDVLATQNSPVFKELEEQKRLGIKVLNCQKCPDVDELLVLRPS
ncbi:hypothetical protein AVEN_44711-1 [Araneus ventricosus]|uniref:Uncharacterized protein n=1 Tax=Araneus ventricosus TaxID=182803 RepID=A0A4Y2K245_ARAVE|nr:hypothetical protein AVEN_239421-1 [Araneus ventricosus]GBM96384.1 hypothetical protein AVEN_44711-1 [Araneus ventricosus]